MLGILVICATGHPHTGQYFTVNSSLRRQRTPTIYCSRFFPKGFPTSFFIMSSDSSEEEMLNLYQYIRSRRRRNSRKYWIHPYIQRNLRCRLFIAAKELQESDAKFLAFYRMSKESYITLVEIITPALQHQNTNMRECVSAEERILITLR